MLLTSAKGPCPGGFNPHFRAKPLIHYPLTECFCNQIVYCTNVPANLKAT